MNDKIQELINWIQHERSFEPTEATLVEIQEKLRAILAAPAQAEGERVERAEKKGK